jgi:hypothetical protein
VINVEPRNEGSDRSIGSTLITHKTQYRNEGRDRSTGSTLTTYKTQYRNEEGIGKPVPH